MESCSDAVLPASGAAFALPVVVPEVLSPEVTAWNKHAAERLYHHSNMMGLENRMRHWKKQRDAMKAAQGDLSRKLKNARSRYQYCKKKSVCLKDADFVEMLPMESEACHMSTDSEPTAAGADVAHVGSEASASSCVSPVHSHRGTK